MPLGKHSNRVARHFESDWSDYDHQIRTAIPLYDQALQTLADVVSHSRLDPARILDLGIGTGNLAHMLLETFPDAHLTGIDMLQDFLDIAGRRLSEHEDRVSLARVDLSDFDFSLPYDLVVTSFTFHHIPDEAKRTAYARIFSCLSSGGCLMNADFVGSASLFYGKIFDALRISYMRDRNLSEEQIRKQYVEHRKLEIPAPMEAQLAWLRDLGFRDVECFWKYLNLAVFGGRKV